MFDPAHMPIVLAQVEQITAASNGLTQGGLTFLVAVMGALVWALYRENRALHEAALKASEDRRKEDKIHADEKIALVKEQLPIAQQLAVSVQSLEKISNAITKD